MAFNRTLKERQDYNFKLAKKGAEKTNPVTGEVKPVSDFERGRRFERAKGIVKKRNWFKNKMEKDPAFRAAYENKRNQ